MYDTIIIGSGVAGFSAALYAGRYRLNYLLIGENFGGETALGGKIENYPGVPALDGFDLMKIMKDQAMKLGGEFVDAKAEKVEKRGHCFTVIANKKEYQAKTLVLAVGAERRRLGLPLEKELTGRGLHYCVMCDGPLYKGKTIAMVGGGDASVKGVNLAAEYAKKIYLIVREPAVRAEPINFEQMRKLGDKIEVLLETEVKELVGDKRLEKVILSKSLNGSNELVINGLFVEIGAVPNVDLAKQLGIELDDHGYVKTDNAMKTSVDGVFAAGDAVYTFGSFKQVVTAAATGAMAITTAYQDYKVHGELCAWHARPASKEATSS